jgi:cytochrome c oxidase cbb3-type subunit 4
MTYDFWSSFAQTWGLVYFIAIFAAVLAYALWPSRKAEFSRAARLPIVDKEQDDDRPLS